MRALLALATKIDRLNEAFARIVRWALLANALLITSTVFSRKFFSLVWVDAFDMQWHFFAAVVLLMAGYTFRRDEHVRIDILAHRFGERGLAWLDLVGIVLVLLPICIAMVWISWPEFFIALMHSETRSTREATSDIPSWIIKGFIPLGFLLLGVQAIAEAIRCVAELKHVRRRPIHRRQLIEGGRHDL